MKRTLGGPVFLIGLALANLLGARPLGEAPQDAPKLIINIVEGEGALNNIKQRVNREPVVQVEDENHKPIAGAAVVFFLPTSGPSGTFANGTQTLTVTTDATGRATATGIKPNQVTGKMQIRVTASANGLTASAVITQANIVGAAASGGLSLTAKVLIIVGIAAAGATAGAIAATHGGGSSSSTSTTPTITITAGTPSVGAPH
ncbi:MAG TPA: hypothetical protein VMT15_18810 [Bryobacteraceae bacterium]|nr:hypothetical protein [Bryobacteraceae bacterium]